MFTRYYKTDNTGEPTKGRHDSDEVRDGYAVALRIRDMWSRYSREVTRPDIQPEQSREDEERTRQRATDAAILHRMAVDLGWVADDYSGHSL